MTVHPLVSQRGTMNCQYAGELADFIERTNCRKGCTHATPEDGGEWINCDFGLLALLFDTYREIPEFEAHGNSYVVCLKRQKPEPKRPWSQPGPTLFGDSA